nr:MAG TPA: hypothetical protein [Caudoviricetes sp.]
MSNEILLFPNNVILVNALYRTSICYNRQDDTGIALNLTPISANDHIKENLMKKTYLDKYFYDIVNLDDHRYSIVIDPIGDQESTDLLLRLGTTNNFASIEGMGIKITNHTTLASERNPGKLSIEFEAYSL